MGRETYFPLQSLCHNAKVVHAFESNTPFEKLPGTQINVPRLNLHSARAAPPVPHFPRFRALALVGRRSPQCVDSLVMPASENLHRMRLMHCSKTGPLSARASSAQLTRWICAIRLRLMKPDLLIWSPVILTYVN